MYLPSFYKMTHEIMAFKSKRVIGYAAPAALWGICILTSRLVFYAFNLQFNLH